MDLWDGWDARLAALVGELPATQSALAALVAPVNVTALRWQNVVQWLHGMPRFNEKAEAMPNAFTPELFSGGPYTSGVVVPSLVFAAAGAVLLVGCLPVMVCCATRWRSRSSLEELLAERATKHLFFRICGPRLMYLFMAVVAVLAAGGALYLCTLLGSGWTATQSNTLGFGAVFAAANASLANAAAGPLRATQGAAAGLYASALAHAPLDNVTAFEVAQLLNLSSLALWAAGNATASYGPLSDSVAAIVDGRATGGVSLFTVTGTYLAWSALGLFAFAAALLLLGTCALVGVRCCARTKRVLSGGELLLAFLVWVLAGALFAVGAVSADFCTAPQVNTGLMASTLPGGLPPTATGDLIFYLGGACTLDRGPYFDPEVDPDPVAAMALSDGVNASGWPWDVGVGVALTQAVEAQQALAADLALRAALVNSSVAWAAAPCVAVLANLSAAMRAAQGVVGNTSCTAVYTPWQAAYVSLCGNLMGATGGMWAAATGIGLLMGGLLVCAAYMCSFHPGDVAAVVAPEEDEDSDGGEEVGADGKPTSKRANGGKKRGETARIKHKTSLHRTAGGGRFHVARAIGQLWRKRTPGSEQGQGKPTTLADRVVEVHADADAAPLSSWRR